MSQDTKHWSCYTTQPEETLKLIEQARAHCPVAHSDEHDGFYMLLNYGDVKNAMSDHKTYSSEPQVLRPMLPRKPIPALEMDPPQHTAWRAIFSQAITAKTPVALESFVRADVNHHIDRFIAQGHCDIVREICEPVPAETICRLMGVDEELVPEIRRLSIEMFAAQGDPPEFARRQEKFAAVTVTQVHARRAAPRDDYLTKLAHTRVDGRDLDDADLVGLMAAFLGAGHHSTTSTMASLIHQVFGQPQLRDAIKAEPSKVVAAVEETLRLRPPFFGFFRRTTRPVSVGGEQIPQGCDVYMGWAAANRDPQAFPQPTEFRLDRGANRHLGFGFGIHTCPGAPVARMELKVVLEELLRRLPDLQIEGEPPAYRFGGGDYAYMPSLQVRFTPGRAATPG